MNFVILLVDDEISQREPIKGFLMKKGYQVVSASSYNEAIQFFKENQIDLVVTDYKLKEKTGLDILKEIKTLNPLIPIIVMTAFGTIEDAVNLMKHGAFDYLQKPIELDELLLNIEKAQEISNLKSENKQLRQQLSEKYSLIRLSHKAEKWNRF